MCVVKLGVQWRQWGVVSRGGGTPSSGTPRASTRCSTYRDLPGKVLQLPSQRGHYLTLQTFQLTLRQEVPRAAAWLWHWHVPGFPPAGCRRRGAVARRGSQRTQDVPLQVVNMTHCPSRLTLTILTQLVPVKHDLKNESCTFLVILICKAKRQQLLTWKVNCYCILALHESIISVIQCLNFQSSTKHTNTSSPRS